MTEVWRDIPGHEGRYQVSDLGRVRSVDHYARTVYKDGREGRRLVKGRVLAWGLSRGYPIVNLFPKGTVAVHLLVARAFVPGETPGYDVNHIDGVKTNSAASNLEWVTKSRNQQHAVETGLRSQAIRVKCPRTGTVFPSITQAAKAAGCRANTISQQWVRV